MSHEQDPTSLSALLARIQDEAVNTKATGSPLSPRNLVAGRFGVEDDGDDLGDDDDHDPVDDIEDDDLDSGKIARRLAVARQMAQGQGPQAPFVRNPSAQVVPTSQEHDSEFVFAKLGRQTRDFILHFGPQAKITGESLLPYWRQISSYLSHYLVAPVLYTGETGYAFKPAAYAAIAAVFAGGVIGFIFDREWGEDIANVVNHEMGQKIAKYLGTISLAWLYFGVADGGNQIGLLSREKPYYDIQFHPLSYVYNLVNGVAQNYAWLLDNMPHGVKEHLANMDMAALGILTFAAIKNRAVLGKLANLTASGASKLAKQAQNRRR